VPELPEVEILARGLRRSLLGRTLVDVDLRWDGCVSPADPRAFARRLKGETVLSVGRRGKWLRIALSGGDTLLLHPRMTGQLLLGDDDVDDDRHVRAVFSLDDGRKLRFVDMRKFGRVCLVADADAVLAELGPEPLSDDFTPARLASMLESRRGRIKPLLLNQRFLAGLGNIYTDEALWQARIHPLRLANTLTPDEVRRLHRSIRAVLRAAIASGGTTLSDETYRHVDGEPGAFSGQLAAYGRTGEGCPRCGTPIDRIRVCGRSTHYCPACQQAG
jgi:formamidopyrimidine-DNA glycosylase